VKFFCSDDLFIGREMFSEMFVFVFSIPRVIFVRENGQSAF